MSWVLIFLMGSLLMAYGSYSLWHYSPSRWRHTVGVVVSATAERLPSNTGLLFVPRVRFEYVVANERFLGGEYAFSSSEDCGGLDFVNKILLSYPVGAEITVWYSMLKPRNSCIKLMSRYSRSQMAAITLGGLIVNALGVFLFVLLR
jgi:hypothetical protein